MAGDLAKLVGRNIALSRHELGMAQGLGKPLTQKKFAQLLNDHRGDNEPETPADDQRVSDWERGVHKPSERYMALIVAASGHDESWFYTEHGAGESPDLLATFSPDEMSQLDRIEAMLVEVLERLGDGAMEELVSGALADREASADRADAGSGRASGAQKAAPRRARAAGKRTA